MAPLSSFVTLTLLALKGVSAHPGHDVFTEAAAKANFFKLKPRTIRGCAAQLEQRGVTQAAVERRQDLASTLRSKRGITHKRMLARRDFSSYDFSHKYTNSSITLDTDEASLFADNSSCTLQTDVTQGPYYVNGELIRQVVTDGQDGIPIYVDIQIIDTSSCEPVPDIYMDFWHANATGVYSGVIANGNGDSSDTSNLDSTAMRGLQQTDENGLVQFQSVFPGHYDGRATHIHIMTHTASSTSVASNGTLMTGDDTTHASHVGQLFFDQDLITQVSQISPYSEITATITENSADSILAQEADTTDPFVEYILLGDNLSDGLLIWISIGIDPTKDSEVQSASTYYESGGVANEDSMGGAPGDSNGNGTMSGSPPNGSGNATMSGSPPSGSVSGTMTGSMPSGSGSATMTGSMPSGSGNAAMSSVASSGSGESGVSVSGSVPVPTSTSTADAYGSSGSSSSIGSGSDSDSGSASGSASASVATSTSSVGSGGSGGSGGSSASASSTDTGSDSGSGSDSSGDNGSVATSTSSAGSSSSTDSDSGSDSSSDNASVATSTSSAGSSGSSGSSSSVDSGSGSDSGSDSSSDNASVATSTTSAGSDSGSGSSSGSSTTTSDSGAIVTTTSASSSTTSLAQYTASAGKAPGGAQSGSLTDYATIMITAIWTALFLW